MAKIKKEAQDVLNSVRSRYESKVYGLQQDKQRAERWEKAAEANAERWRNRFFSLWPDAAAAIEAIVMRCTTMIRSFTTAHIASIEKALRNARSMEERKEYASDLWDMAKDEMPGTTPKAWIQEGKKDLDLLVEYGPEQYLKQERSRTQNRECTCNGTIQFQKYPAARLAQGVCGYKATRKVWLFIARQKGYYQQTNFFTTKQKQPCTLVVPHGSRRTECKAILDFQRFNITV